MIDIESRIERAAERMILKERALSVGECAGWAVVFMSAFYFGAHVIAWILR
jgi:hypothetical protein